MILRSTGPEDSESQPNGFRDKRVFCRRVTARSEIAKLVQPRDLVVRYEIAPRVQDAPEGRPVSVTSPGMWEAFFGKKIELIKTKGLKERMIVLMPSRWTLADWPDPRNTGVGDIRAAFLRVANRSNARGG
jgi:hypothetical protein